MMADMNNDILKVLITEEELKNKVQELGAAISRDYEGKNLLMVSVLKGSVIFMADLMRAITIPAQIDFMSVSSYGAGLKYLKTWMPSWREKTCCWWRISWTAASLFITCGRF